MGLRVGQLAGVFAFALMIGRLGRLLLTGPTEPQWNLVLTAAALLGGIAWWLLGQMTTRSWPRIALFAAAGLLLVIRVSAPNELAWGVLPTRETLSVLGQQLEVAFQILRSGVPPVSAGGGILALLCAATWGIGALYTWGSTGGPTAALFLPSLILYFQFAVYDRDEAGMGWVLASGTALGLAVLAVALERRSETGRARDAEGRPLGRRSAALASITVGFLVVGSITVAQAGSDVVSEYGNVPWRGALGGGGYGEGGGGVRYDRLVDLRQQVLSDNNNPVFEATVGPGAPPASEMIFRMETLDLFDGDTWRRSNTSTAPVELSSPIATPDDVYQGPNRYDFVTNIRIRGMTTDVIPTAGVPVAVLEPQGSGNQIEPTDLLSLTDAALVGRDNLGRDDTYTVRTIQPVRRADLGLLATGPDGELTPLFASAAAAGEFPHEPQVSADAPVEPSDLDSYYELPGSLPRAIETLARQVTLGAESDFERAWMLQSFFRDGDRFTYDADATTGHSSLVLADWLTEPTSRNYRIGYCEQFAAAMAVMARSVGVPSRVVWGFTPGSVETQSNGEEIVVVRRRNAHAWVEIWMPQTGWTAFDPTPRAEQTDYQGQLPSLTAGLDPTDYVEEPEANSNPLQRPGDISNLGGEEFPPFLESDADLLRSSRVRWWLIGVVAAALIAAAIPVAKWVRRRRRLARVRNGDITAAWDEIVDRLTDLGVEVSPSLTPLELARATDSALMPLAVSYASTIYGGRTGQAEETDLYGVEWWIDRTYDVPTRARAALSWRSFLPRD